MECHTGSKGQEKSEMWLFTGDPGEFVLVPAPLTECSFV